MNFRKEITTNNVPRKYSIEWFERKYPLKWDQTPYFSRPYGYDNSELRTTFVKLIKSDPDSLKYYQNEIIRRKNLQKAQYNERSNHMQNIL